MNTYLNRIIQRTIEPAEASIPNSHAQAQELENDFFDPFDKAEPNIEALDEDKEMNQDFNPPNKVIPDPENKVFIAPAPTISPPEYKPKPSDTFTKSRTKENEEPIYTLTSGNLPESYFSNETQTKQIKDIEAAKLQETKPKKIKPKEQEELKNKPDADSQIKIAAKKNNQSEERQIKPIQPEKKDLPRKKEEPAAPKLFIGRLTVEVLPAAPVQATNRSAPIQKSTEMVKSNFNTKRLLLGIKQM